MSNVAIVYYTAVAVSHSKKPASRISAWVGASVDLFRPFLFLFFIHIVFVFNGRSGFYTNPSPFLCREHPTNEDRAVAYNDMVRYHHNSYCCNDVVFIFRLNGESAMGGGATHRKGKGGESLLGGAGASYDAEDEPENENTHREQ